MVTLTENAAKKALSLLQKQGKGNSALRLKVVSGGCSGFEYRIEPDSNPPQAHDHVAQSHGVTIYMDPKSLLYMAGSELDYVSSLTGAGFKVKNPQAVAECSCGHSFTT